MKYLLLALLCSCAKVATEGDVKVITRSGVCQKSFTEDISKNKFHVIYFCGEEGAVVIEVTENEKN